ncbi:ABC transporter ATP-binding protein [Salipaludibacillus agaradhaerens]|uniref:ABC transporter ATP-binding protein n=1 Tax=Salipaludibacillus agaradhaerens TaxID=76935 RepID=A0A9Q4B3D3_SALAG|nr:energy-coupling factor transporter ATPase [Salipaludibacillus agaradhaerens]MCR6097584.1 ABC transporter ATP-binding protein [Salipaludibacillus agaradhaerens]MCR6112932.1 ABC transporter ATP-binding protein [Salipaludibacillus agaradhaerens]
MKNQHPDDRHPIIRVEDLVFAYEKNHEKPLIDHVSFTLEEGELTLLMGASGSGKSTLALSLNGLYPEVVEGFQKGNIFFRGVPLENYEKGVVNQHIGIVFQDPESQFCMVTVENELAFTMENCSIPRSEMKKRMDDVLKITGLTNMKKRAIHELSGGQKQKVALASVLLLEPDVLILDEPTANLDPVSSLEFIELVAELQRKTRLTVVVIEHQLDDWLPFAHRILALGKNGRLFADGKPKDVLTKQADQFKSEGIYLPCEKASVQSPIANDPYDSHEAILQIENLTFNRKEKKILTELNVSLRKGEFIAIVGENGAGKSTLLQVMAGLLSPKQGKVIFLGQTLDEWTEGDLRRAMGFVFQNPEHQFITDTVADELAFGMKLNDQNPSDIENKVAELLHHFQLENHRWHNPFSLSGGQKRRLSVATMLDETPELLLFDEPTFGQDAHTTTELMKIILDLKAKGTTIVFVTHDMNLVDMYSERVIVLDEGRLAFQGTPAELWSDHELVYRARLRLPHRLQKQVKAGEVI